MAHNIEKTCKECQKLFTINWNKRDQEFCSNHCSAIARNKNSNHKNILSQRMAEAYSSEESRKRLRDIGRKGGFGTRGITSEGTRYESLFEKKSFEYLEKNHIPFEPHKPIPNSSKVSDIYLIDRDLWIELDGINREAKKKWLGTDYKYWKEKLKLYQKLGLRYQICLTFNQFISWT
jgi:endogenous inhibitor of DNA gyrase (YacG/DUF329 family)